MACAVLTVSGRLWGRLFELEAESVSGHCRSVACIPLIEQDRSLSCELQVGSKRLRVWFAPYPSQELPQTVMGLFFVTFCRNWDLVQDKGVGFEATRSPRAGFIRTLVTNPGLALTEFLSHSICVWQGAAQPQLSGFWIRR
jgi:hypothetical protein